MRVRVTLRLKHDAVLREREKLGMTQKQFAELAGVPIAFLQKVESLGISRPETHLGMHSLAQKLTQLAGCLDMAPDALYPDWLKDLPAAKCTRCVDLTPGMIAQSGDATGERLALPAPMDTAHTSERDGKIEAVLNTLAHREREVVKLLFGLADGYTYSLEEVGRIFNVTRERVRQIKLTAIRKMQGDARASELVDFADIPKEPTP